MYMKNSYTVRMIKNFAMKPQEIKPKGRRAIGRFLVRAAHNVHKVDVCACSLPVRKQKKYIISAFLPSSRKAFRKLPFAN